MAREKRHDASPHAGVFLRLARRVVFHNVRIPIRLALNALCGVRLIGEERVPLDGGLIVACNHTSLADPVVLQAYFPRFLTYMMTERFYYLPVLERLLRFWGVLVIREEGLNKESLRAAAEALGGGAAVGIFPEGGISRDGLVHDARPGVALLARRAGVPILPVGVAGIEKLLPPDTLRLSRSPIGIYVGELIPPQGESRDALAARVTAAIRECTRRARQCLAEEHGTVR